MRLAPAPDRRKAAWSGRVSRPWERAYPFTDVKARRSVPRRCEDARMARRAIAILIDSVAFVGFVVLGVREHSETPGAVLILRNAVPILASWFPVALATGAYRTLDIGSLLSTWIVGLP